MDGFLVRPATAQELERIEPLWGQLYDHQQATGMLLSIPPGEFQSWASSLTSMLDRFTYVLLVEAGTEIVGFSAGRVRPLPAYFGGGQAGFISEVYVCPERRGLGLGTRLVQAGVDWFQTRGIRRVELQVLTNNSEARRLYQKLGWQEELTQMVWCPPTER